MAARKTIRRKAGDASNTLSGIEEQVNLTDVLVAVDQLQETVNKVLSAMAGRDVVWTGGLVTKDTGALTVDVTAGELRLADGTHKAFNASSNLALTAAHASLARIDIVQIATATGTITKKDGTAAASPVAPAADAGNIILATVPVAALATEPGTPTDVRPRLGVITGSGAVADTALFVTADQ